MGKYHLHSEDTVVTAGVHDDGLVPTQTEPGEYPVLEISSSVA